MKLNLTTRRALGFAAGAILSTLVFCQFEDLRADSQGGATVGPVMNQAGQTLNTQVVPVKLVQQQLIQNEGLTAFGLFTTPQQSGTSPQTTSTNTNVSGYLATANLTIGGTTPAFLSTIGPGTVLTTSTSVETYLTSTTALIVKTGTVISATGASIYTSGSGVLNF
jgi:hypothetical protein